MINVEDIKDSFNESLNIIDNDVYAESLNVVACTIRDKIVKTLGPYAHTTIIDDGTYKYPTKDGWNILKRIRSTDPLFNSILNFLVQVATKLVGTVGDGTTTAYVTAANFINHFNYAMNDEDSELHHARQTDIISALESIAKDIKDIIYDENNKLIKFIDKDGDFSDIYNIAKVSSNGNEKVASVIQDIYAKTKNPNIYVTLDKCDSVEGCIQDGFKMDLSLINREIYANSDGGDFVSDSGIMVVLFNHNITFAGHGALISFISKYAATNNKTILFCAPNYDDTIMSIMGSQLNNLVKNGSLPYIMFAQTGLTRSIQRNYYKDFSIIANAEIIDSDKMHLFRLLLEPQNEEQAKELGRYKELLGLDTLDPNVLIQEYLGFIRNVRINKSELFCDINPESEKLKIHIQKVNEELNDARERNLKFKNNDDELLNLKLRTTRLNGKIGVIKVGGASEIDKQCMKDSVDDAVLSCKSAFDNGYVRGFNITLFAAFEICGTLKYTSTGVKSELLDMFVKSLYSTTLSMVRNKYMSDQVRTTADELADIDNIINNCIDNNLVYDLVTEEFMSFDDSDCNIINPAQTDVEIVNAIVSLLSLILTSNQMISSNKFMSFKETKSQFIARKSTEYADLINNTIKQLDKDTLDTIKSFFKKFSN